MNWIKLLRTTGWLLIAATLLTLFSGFLTTKYFLSPLGYTNSYFLHTIVIPLIFIPLMYVHSLAGILFAAARHARNNKKLKIIAAGAWTAIFVMFIAFYAAQYPAQSAGNSTNAYQLSGPVQNQTVTMLTPSELAKHNSAGDCWLLISGKVYDVTSYLMQHPGGAGTIAPYCGKDATSAFATKDAGRPHSPAAEALLASYYIGDLGEAIANVSGSPNSSAGGVQYVIINNYYYGNGTLANTTTSIQDQPPDSQQGSMFTLQQIAAHDSASDCWIVISGSVYDVTSYIGSHPGGAGTITPYCGKDASAAFNGQGHSSYAYGLLGSYYIGDVGAVPPPPQIPVNQTNATNQNSSTGASGNASLDNVTSPAASFTVAEIAGHNSASSCWLIIGSSVYDVTSYLPVHPGGINAILPYCGGDGTAVFSGLPHSSNANALLASYLIGNVGSAGQASQPNASQSNSTGNPWTGVNDSVAQPPPSQTAYYDD